MAIGAGQIKRYTFNTTDTIMDQISNLTNQSWTFGYIASAESGIKLGLPVNDANFDLIVYKHSASYANVIAIPIGDASRLYMRGQRDATWNDWRYASFTVI